jgi:signal transduction histidine kinase
MRHRGTIEAVNTAMQLDEAGWVDARLLQEFLSSDREYYRWVFVVFPTLVAMLYGHVATGALMLWVLAMTALLGTRLWHIRHYHLEEGEQAAGQRRALMQRLGWLWPANAVMWGLSAWLHLSAESDEQLMLCWLVLLGLGTHAIVAYSSHLATLRAYVNALSLTAISAMLADLISEFDTPDASTYDYWLLLLIILFWQFLLQAGQRLHGIRRAHFELQFRNLHLIDSLTHQSAAAQTAMEIKNRFLASAAHDIRQPVHALSLYAELLASEPHMADEITPKIVKSTKAVNALFESLFDLVQLDSGRIRVNVEAIDLPRFLHELELQYRPRAEAKGLAFRVRVRAGEILSDPILLRRIVGNLLDNAVKYTDKGGILLAARFSNDRVRIEVRDTGIGIAPEYQEQVFQEFYKVPERQGTADGFGLGLAIVARLKSVLGHRLIMSSYLGKGTVFRLELQSLDTVDSDQRAAKLDT